MPYEYAATASFGATSTGLTTVGYQLRNTDGSIALARTTIGVAEVAAGSGVYRVFMALANVFRGYILWDTGGGSPKYAGEAINPPSDVWSVVRETYNGDPGATFGGHLNALTPGLVAATVWDRARASHVASGTFGEALQLADRFAGVAVAATATTIQLGTNEGTEIDYTNWSITITKHAGQGQSRMIASYIPATRTATLDRAWDVTPDTSSEYSLWPPVAVDAGGLDLVAIETGFHLRRSIRAIAAATAGVETRPTATNVVYAALGNSGTTRISSTINAGTGVREAVTLSLGT